MQPNDSKTPEDELSTTPNQDSTDSISVSPDGDFVDTAPKEASPEEPATSESSDEETVDTNDLQSSDEVSTESDPSTAEINPSQDNNSVESTPVDALNEEPETDGAIASPETPESTVQPTEPQPVNGSVVQPESVAVAGAASVAAAQMASGNGGKGRKKKLTVLLIAVIAILLLAAGGAGAYFGLYLPNQPERIAKDTIANTFDSQKFGSAKFEGDIDFSGGDVEEYVSKITFKGAADKSNKIDLNITANTPLTKVGVDARSIDGKSAFFRLTGLDGIDKIFESMDNEDSTAESSLIAQYLPLLVQLNDQWYSVDESLLSQAQGSDAPSTSFSQEDTNKITKAYENNPFINVTERLDDETIHGIKSYHVRAKIDKDTFNGFAQEIKSANINNVLITQEDIDELENTDFSKYPIDIWIDKKNRVLSQVSMSVQEQGTTIKFRVAMYDVNQPVTVEEPIDAKSVLELIGEIAPLFRGQSDADTTSIGSPMMSL